MKKWSVKMSQNSFKKLKLNKEIHWFLALKKCKVSLSKAFVREFLSQCRYSSKNVLRMEQASGVS